MQATVDPTLDYLKTRTRFGQPRGRFQALQLQQLQRFLRSAPERVAA